MLICAIWILYNFIVGRITRKKIKLYCRVPSYQVRNSFLLEIPCHHTLYGYNSPLTRLTRLTHEFNDLDFVGTSYTALKSYTRLTLNM
jgi:hypothetical protein